MSGGCCEVYTTEPGTLALSALRCSCRRATSRADRRGAGGGRARAPLTGPRSPSIRMRSGHRESARRLGFRTTARPGDRQPARPRPDNRIGGDGSPALEVHRPCRPRAARRPISEATWLVRRSAVSDCRLVSSRTASSPGVAGRRTGPWRTSRPTLSGRKAPEVGETPRQPLSQTQALGAPNEASLVVKGVGGRVRARRGGLARVTGRGGGSSVVVGPGMTSPKSRPSGMWSRPRWQESFPSVFPGPYQPKVSAWLERRR